LGVKTNQSPPPGTVYHHLTVLLETAPKYFGKTSRRRLLCRCECSKVVIVRMDYVTTGMTKSCGCGVLRKKSVKNQTLPWFIKIGLQEGILTIHQAMKITHFNKLEILREMEEEDKNAGTSL